MACLRCGKITEPRSQIFEVLKQVMEGHCRFTIVEARLEVGGDRRSAAAEASTGRESTRGVCEARQLPGSFTWSPPRRNNAESPEEVRVDLPPTRFGENGLEQAGLNGTVITATRFLGSAGPAPGDDSESSSTLPKPLLQSGRQDASLTEPEQLAFGRSGQG